jgi:protein SCO1
MQRRSCRSSTLALTIALFLAGLPMLSGLEPALAQGPAFTLDILSLVRGRQQKIEVTMCLSACKTIRESITSARRRTARGFLIGLCLACATAAWTCNRNAAPLDEPGSYVSDNPADCLPPVTLLNQFGKTVSLASLKGKPVLVDFIYTRCPGLCETMTLKMARVADDLKTELGSRVTMVSVTLDPADDGPAQLLKFAKKLGAQRYGWLFLTGKLDQIETVLEPYKVKRVVEGNGEIDHVLEMFLLGPDGKQVRLYSATSVAPQTVAADVKRELARA